MKSKLASKHSITLKQVAELSLCVFKAGKAEYSGVFRLHCI